MQQSLQAAGPDERCVVASGQDATSLLLAHSGCDKRSVSVLAGFQGIRVGSLCNSVPTAAQGACRGLLVVLALLSELVGNIELLIIRHAIAEAFFVPAKLIVGIGAANHMLPPLSRDEHRSLHLPFEHYAAKRAGVLMGDQVIEKLLVPCREVRALSVKALPRIVNDVN